jgi:hypothetical protein
LLAGGGLSRGSTYGSTDAQGMAPTQDLCSPDDVSATIFRALGFEPHHEVQTPAGRPVALFRQGKVIGKLLE